LSILVINVFICKKFPAGYNLPQPLLEKEGLFIRTLTLPFARGGDF